LTDIDLQRSILTPSIIRSGRWRRQVVPTRRSERYIDVTRSPQEILSDHLAAVEHGDIATIVEDYREDAVLLT